MTIYIILSGFLACFAIDILTSLDNIVNKQKRNPVTFVFSIVFLIFWISVNYRGWI